MQQIADWLTKLGMSEYAERFAENRIDLSVLPELTDQHLEKLGVALGDRLKILRAIRELSATTVAAQPGPSAAPVGQGSAERRQLTVMFCDLVGSTALSAKLDPEDLREIVGAYHRCCTELVERNGGFVAKYMGDAVLAYFGYPQAHQHDAERAVRAALNLVETVPKLATRAGSPLQVRVGIATGLVVVGDLIGAGAAQEQAVVGETPNLAARLRALAEPGAVVIASSTRRLTGGLFEYRDLGAVTLKGFAKDVPAWRVLGVGSAESRFEALRATTTPLIGRDEEIDLLLRRWRRAKAGNGCVVLISGEPGIGKSRIVETVLERLRDEPHTRLRYFCSPHHQDSALYPAISQLERAAGFERNDTPDIKLTKLATLFGPSRGRESDALLLAELLSIPTADCYAPLNWSALQKKLKTFEVLLMQLDRLSRRRPALVVYEDIHWIDPSSRELLDMIVEHVASLPVLLVITFRPEFQPPWIGQAHVSTLNLGRLGRCEGAVLVEGVAGNNTLPNEITAEIVERADGIPLFVEELTKAVLETGAYDDAGIKIVSATLPPGLAVPATLHASLMARLDRLGPAAKETAQIGAVIGREFSYELLALVARVDQAELQAACGRLTASGLVFCRGMPPQATFLFKHALVRDAAYASLLRTRRQQLNACIASALEAQFPEIVDKQPERLAQHCTEGDKVDKALVYWAIAARQSVTRHTMIEAVAQARSGLRQLELLPDNPARWRQELELQSVLGGALNGSVGAAAPETGQAYSRARMLSERLGDTSAFVAVLSGLASHNAQRCELATHQQIAVDLLRHGENENDIACRLQGHRTMGANLYWRGEFRASRGHLERTLSLYVPETHRPMISVVGFDARAVALSYSSCVLFILGYPGRALTRSREALSWARELNHPHALVHSLNALSVYNLVRCAHLEAKATLDEQVALAEEHRISFWLPFANVMLGRVLALQGETARGLALSRMSFADMTATHQACLGHSFLR